MKIEEVFKTILTDHKKSSNLLAYSILFFIQTFVLIASYYFLVYKEDGSVVFSVILIVIQILFIIWTIYDYRSRRKISLNIENKINLFKKSAFYKSCLKEDFNIYRIVPGMITVWNSTDWKIWLVSSNVFFVKKTSVSSISKKDESLTDVSVIEFRDVLDNCVHNVSVDDYFLTDEVRRVLL